MQRGPALGFLIIGTAIFGLGVLLELPMLLMSAMMFYAPGSAAKAMLDPKPASRSVPTAAHAGGCPCCSGGTVL